MSAFHLRYSCVLVLASLLLLIAPAAPAAEKSTRRDRFDDPLPDEAIYRIGSARFRVGSPVYFLAFSKDGKTLLSVNQNNICRWNAATGKQLHKIELNGGRGYLALSPDGRLLAARSHDRGGGPIWIDDASTGRFLSKLEVPGAEGGIAFGPDSRMLAANDDKGVIHLCDALAGKVLGELKGQAPSCTALTFSPDGKILASAQQNGVNLWDVPARRHLRRLSPERDHEWIDKLVFSPDGKQLVALGNRALRLWNTATGQKVWDIPREGRSRSALAFSSDGQIIASENHYGVVCLLKAATGKEIRRLKCWGDLNCLAFSPDGAMLAVGEENIRLHRVESGEEMRPVGDPSLDIEQAVFAPDGRLLVTSESDGTIRLWDADTGAPGRRFKGRPEGNSLVGFSADGKSLFTRHEGRQVNQDETRFRQWDLPSGKEQRCISAPPDALCAALSSTGRILAWASKEGVIHVRDAATGAELRSWRTKGKTWTELQTSYRALRFSTQDRWLGMGRLFGGQSEVREVKTGTECSFSKKETGYLAFSPDGQIAAYLIPKKPTDSGLFGRQWRGPEDEQLIGFQDTATGERLASTDLAALLKLSLGDSIAAEETVFSPDGRTFATTIERQPVRFWETATGKERYRLPPEQSGNVERLTFAPDGNKFVTTGTAKLAVVWRVFGPQPGQRPSELSAAEQRALWADLASEDGQIAFRAIRTLTASPRSAVELLQREVQPVPRLDPERLARWISDLDADDFSVREQATAQLKDLGLSVEEALRAAQRNHPTLEARRRLERLLDNLRKQRMTADRIRNGRALEVLEHLTIPEGGQLLETLARGEPAALLTREARVSLDRLRQRSAK